MGPYLCTICARGGSKGVANKNLRELCGKPLIAHTLEQARESGLFSRIAVSSDSGAILETAERWGADVLVERPADLATDSAPKLPAVQHCLMETERRSSAEFSIVVDLDPTAPLRSIADIGGAVGLCVERGVKNVVTAAPSRKSPYFNLVEVNGQGVVRPAKYLGHDLVRRQDTPATFDMNASIYVWRREALREATSLWQDDTALFVMPEERSVDIDSELDFEFVEFLLRRGASI